VAVHFRQNEHLVSTMEKMEDLVAVLERVMPGDRVGLVSSHHHLLVDLEIRAGVLPVEAITIPMVGAVVRVRSAGHLLTQTHPVVKAVMEYR
jgi:hypothetical protein